MPNTDTNIIKSSDCKQLLSNDWTLFKSDPDEYQSPSEFEFSRQQAKTTAVPCTVASSLDLPEPECWTPPLNYDDYDWWYQKEFTLSNNKNNRLIFEGLATICEVWINDHSVLTSNNMFIKNTIDLIETTVPLKSSNILTICFRALNQQLKQKKPRPKWKAKLVSNQSLRWFRTTLLGRIPGWTPPVSPVGPWRPIYLQDKLQPYNISLTTKVENNSGYVQFSGELNCSSSTIECSMKIGELEFRVEVNKEKSNKSNALNLKGELELKDVDLWWPHTHGEPTLYQPTLVINIDEKTTEYTLNKIGFKHIELDRSNDNFQISVNNQRIFCRGACWTTNDIISLNGNQEDLRKTLVLMQEAGANMIRIGGTMVYENDAFYQFCDELGIMIWQDFMFANMDYPFEDESFLSSVLIEVKQQIERLKQYACLTLFCGNSEIQQQIAMQGFEQSVWEIPFYDETLAKLCNELVPNHPYVSSSPSGGDLPFRSNQGLSHYYGVGAYLCPVSELRKHDVKFTSECLGFSNIPTIKTRNAVLNGQIPVTHNPIWKQRTPRDSGTGWDFEDVRDHYLRQLFSVYPIELRGFDPERYIQLSEIVTGEIMNQCFAEWRSNNSNCNGGLVWFMNDLWPGAGWGLIDSDDRPKACYYSLKRVWQPINIHLTDESLNGIQVHVTNENTSQLDGTILIRLLNHNNTEITNSSREIQVPSRSSVQFGCETMLNQFYDVTYRYQFGPSNLYAVLVQLINKERELLSECFYFPKADIPKPTGANSLQVEISQISNQKFVLSLSSTDFLYGINIELKQACPQDNFFHMFPDSKKNIIIHTEISLDGPLKGFISAVNMDENIRIRQKN